MVIPPSRKTWVLKKKTQKEANFNKHWLNIKSWNRNGFQGSLPKKRFHRIQMFHVVSLQENSHSLQKISACRKTCIKSCEKFCHISYYKYKFNHKYKGSAQKTREAPFVFQVWGSVWCLPATPNPKLCSTSRPVKLPGCAGHCTLAFATVWMGITSRFDLWALACVRNWHGFARNSYRIMECQKSAAPH